MIRNFCLDFNISSKLGGSTCKLLEELKLLLGWLFIDDLWSDFKSCLIDKGRCFGGGGGGANNYAGGAGGGGSSYIHTSITNGQTISGVDIDNKTGTERGTVPGSTETEWNGTAGSQAATKAKEGEAPDGQITITVIDPNAQPSVSVGGSRGLASGDWSTAAKTDIEYFDIQTAGASASFGSLNTGRSTHGSISNGRRTFQYDDHCLSRRLQDRWAWIRRLI